MKRPPATKISWDIAAAPVRPPLMIGFDSPPSLQKLFPMAPTDLFLFLDKAEKKEEGDMLEVDNGMRVHMHW